MIEGAEQMDFKGPCLLDERWLSPLFDHVIETTAAAGLDGRPLFHPNPGAARDPAYRAAVASQIVRAVGAPGWRRIWAYCVDGAVVAQGELRGGEIAAAAHRASLGMSVSPRFQGARLGGRLLSHLVDWAREAGLAWIDLGVFEDNAPARRLYERFGFKETGRVEDVFRVEGVSISDVKMALDLRAKG